MGFLGKKKNKQEAAEMLAAGGFGVPQNSVKKQSRKEKKQGDIWKYKVKWGQSVNDATFNNLSQLMNYVASQSDFLASHKMEDTIVAYKVNQDEVLDYALEVFLPLTKEVEAVLEDFDSKERKPFARSLVTNGPASQQEAERLAEAKEEVVDEFTQQQAAFGQAALERVQEKNEQAATPPSEAPEAPVTGGWGMLGELVQNTPEEPTGAENGIARPWPPADVVKEEKTEETEPIEEQPEEAEDAEQVTIEVAATADSAPQAVSAEDSVLDSLIKAQFQLSKELDIDKEALLKAEIEEKATAALKKHRQKPLFPQRLSLKKQSGMK